MRKFFYFLFLLLTASFLFWQKDTLVSRLDYLLSGPCDQPVAYRLGVVDGEYQISRDEFLAKIRQAEAIWEQAAGKDLFAFDPQAELAINLVYTQRQAVLDKLEHLEGTLLTGKGDLETMMAEYEKLSQNFESRLGAFNQEVAFWNQRDGAPFEIYEDLIKKQDELKAEADRLNAMAQKLNLSVEEYNIQVGEFNKNIEAYNEAAARRPEAGLYDGSIPKIDIYLTISNKELIHTLAHELGHALGLDHFEDPQAIMYPFSSEMMKASAGEVGVLKATCEEKNWQRYWLLLRKELKIL